MHFETAGSQYLKKPLLPSLLSEKFELEKSLDSCATDRAFFLLELTPFSRLIGMEKSGKGKKTPRITGIENGAS